MDSLTTDSQLRPSILRKYRRHLLAVLVLLIPLLIFIVIVYVNAPRSLHVIGTYPMVSPPFQGGTLNPHTTGFFTQPDAKTFTLRGWDGVLRWQVTPVAVTLPPQHIRWLYPVRDIGCSPDGRYFACATVLHSTLLVEIWHEGKPVGRHTLLLPKKSIEKLVIQTVNDGRVFVRIRYSGQATMPMIVLQANAVLGRGTVPAGGLLAPDAAIYLTQKPRGFSCARIIVKDSVVSLLNIRYYANNMDIYNQAFKGYRLYPGIFSDGKIVNRNGTIYDIDRRITHTTPSMTNIFSISTSGRYMSYPLSRNRTRIFAPATGDAWEFTTPEYFWSHSVTDDGRFVMLSGYSTPNIPLYNLPQPLHTLLYRLPQPPINRLTIYERPGILRATHRFNDWDWQRYCLSPDGHAVVVYTLDGKCILYRW